MAKYLAQIFMLGAQVVGRAFTRALKQEYAAAQAAAGQRKSTAGESNRSAANDTKLGISLEEAMNILNLKELNKEEIEKNYQHLFKINDKVNGGSFYLQSKSLNLSTNLIFMDQRRLFTSLNLNNDEFTQVLNEENLKKFIEQANQIKFLSKEKIPKYDNRASVLIPFCLNPDTKEASLIMTLRSSNLSSHKWQVCFPGGKEDDNDANHEETALRETYEEIGLNKDFIKIIGSLNPLPTISYKSLVYPVIGFVNTENELNFKLDENEVERVFYLPLRNLCKSENWSYTKWRNGFTTPIYKDEIFNGKSAPKIWGLTSSLLFFCTASLLPNHFKSDISIFLKRPRR